MLASKFILPITCAMSLAAFSASAEAQDGPYTWTGFYIGAHAGYIDLDLSAEEIDGTQFNDSTDSKGGKYGIQGGYNKQIGDFLLGVEADASYLGVDSVDIDLKDTYSVDYDWFATARVRAGVVVQDNLVLFSTGGLAFTELQTGQGDSGLIAGFSLGAGAEYMIAPNWSIKGEYLFTDFGTLQGDGSLPDDTDFQPSSDLFQIGFNWHF